MKTLSVVLLTFLFFARNPVQANDEGAKEITEKESVKKEAQSIAPAPDEKKEYTYEEFRRVVEEEVVKTLKKLKQGKIVEFSKELMKKEDDITVFTQNLKRREESLSLNMSKFEQRVAEFRKEQDKILGCLVQQDKDHKKRIEHMVETISGMKPASAASLLAVQDSAVAVEILGLLPPVKVSKIFNLMEKEVSARLQKQYLTMKK